MLLRVSITEAQGAEKPAWGLKLTALPLSCAESPCGPLFVSVCGNGSADPQGLPPPSHSRPFKPGEAAPAIPYLQGHTVGPDAG